MSDTPGKMLRAVTAESPIFVLVRQLVTTLGPICVVFYLAGGVRADFAQTQKDIQTLRDDLKSKQGEDADFRKGVAADIKSLQQQMFLLQIATTPAPTASSVPSSLRGNP